MLLVENGAQATGVWWYTKDGTQKNVPPPEHGGPYSMEEVVAAGECPMI
jgi:hypothetical protein